jgi:DNA-binding response OmpR family regulator
MVNQRPLIVLVAEDDEDCRELYKLALDRAGFVAHIAATVAQARAILATVRPEVLIADYALPDGTGADVLELCKRAKPRVCILLTGHRTKDVKSAGFDVALRKPIAGDELIAVIKAHGAGM